ncbi:unnamed protein product [Strongylus vulgaris]|uniref:Uncharacterized protein n=1 Tax=Strongylus vulgaris TaxID=40348 RepID=A0A3P7KL40_STRVU|nr:unnamed protein product [Strongylus vulgaris]
MSDFDSSSDSPTRPMTSATSIAPSQFSFPMGSLVPPPVIYPHVLPEEQLAVCMPPPPYSVMPPPTEELSFFPESLVHQPLEHPILLPQQVKQEEIINSASSFVTGVSHCKDMIDLR